jgi:hypothetical protein
MTTNVTISTNYVHPGKKLRVQSINPTTGDVYRDLSVTPEKVAEHGGTYTCETLYIHDAAKLVVEEVEGDAVAQS